MGGNRRNIPNDGRKEIVDKVLKEVGKTLIRKNGMLKGEAETEITPHNIQLKNFVRSIHMLYSVLEVKTTYEGEFTVVPHADTDKEEMRIIKCFREKIEAMMPLASSENEKEVLGKLLKAVSPTTDTQPVADLSRPGDVFAQMLAQKQRKEW